MSALRLLPNRKLTSVAIVISAVLVVEAVVGTSATQLPLINPKVDSVTITPAALSVHLRVTSGRPYPVPVHAALFTGHEVGVTRQAYLLADPNFPAVFGGTPDVLALGVRVSQQLTQMGSNQSLRTVTADQLANVLTHDSTGILVVVEYGILPSTIFSNTTDLLGPWIRGGGTLIWAGGPLGYYNGTVGSPPGRWVPSGPAWNGQVRLVGFPLTDPPVAAPPGWPAVPLGGPVMGSIPSPLAQGLALGYNGTIYGANVSQLVSHGGLSMGFLSGTDPNAIGARTSIAFLRVGLGAIYYFGGAVGGPTHQTVPYGGLRLSLDVAHLLAFDLAPVAGRTSTQDTTVPPAGVVTMVLTIPLSSSGILLLVETAVEGVVFYAIWGPLAKFAPPGGTPP